jgi:hypothetical protein
MWLELGLDVVLTSGSLLIYLRSIMGPLRRRSFTAASGAKIAAVE